MKVLLVYPTPFRITGLPIGVARLCAVLKKSGHQVKVFDTAFYGAEGEESQTRVRSERMISKEIKNEDKYLPLNASGMEPDIIGIIKEYKPDIIGLSILEVVYGLSLRITRLIKKNFKDIPVIAGGVFPTLCPEVVINESSIDMVCAGEGETALVELCNNMASNKGLTDIKGLWVKSGGKVHKNMPSGLHDINALPYPDFTEFDRRLFYKPMQGRMYKMVSIATSRGCSFDCSFCAGPQLRKFFRENECGRYRRSVSVDNVIRQIHFQLERHDPEFIYFSSESFLSMSEKELSLFTAEYEKIGLPFWIQTRIETLTEKRLSVLKRAGMHWLSIGLEHGNEEFRKKVLKRPYSNKMFFEKMEILKKLDMGASINNMIGFPSETRDLIFDTVRMNRILRQKNPRLETNVFMLTPYRGSELYRVCREKGLLPEAPSTSTSVVNASGKSIINFSEEFQKDLAGLARTFNLYVRLSEKDYGRIKIAEQCNEEGNAMLRELADLTGMRKPL